MQLEEATALTDLDLDLDPDLDRDPDLVPHP
jgi:hypothetical protein